MNFRDTWLECALRDEETEADPACSTGSGWLPSVSARRLRCHLAATAQAHKANDTDCTERVIYSIPIFRLKKDFVAMSTAMKHVGLYTIIKAIPLVMKNELGVEGIWISCITFLLKPGTDLVVALLERGLRARMKELETG